MTANNTAHLILSKFYGILRKPKLYLEEFCVQPNLLHLVSLLIVGVLGLPKFSLLNCQGSIDWVLRTMQHFLTHLVYTTLFFWGGQGGYKLGYNLLCKCGYRFYTTFRIGVDHQSPSKFSNSISVACIMIIIANNQFNGSWNWPMIQT